MTRDELSVREHMTDHPARCSPAARFREFVELFDPLRGVAVLVVSFLAVLELAREGLIEVTQSEAVRADLRADRRRGGGNGRRDTP